MSRSNTMHSDDESLGRREPMRSSTSKSISRRSATIHAEALLLRPLSILLGFVHRRADRSQSDRYRRSGALCTSQPTIFVYAYSNSSGAVVERIAHTAYGQPTFMNAAGTVQSTSPNSIRYSYTGREWDAALQLHYFRARWMGPVTGRFLGRDPRE